MSIKKIMNIDLIRDEIVSHISPVDTINYILAGGNKHIYADTFRHVNIFKFIICDKEWFQNKLTDGYTFLLISPTLLDLVRHNIYGYRACKACRPQMLDIAVILIALKNNQVVNCSDEFIDKSVFTDSTVSNISVLNNTYKDGNTRFIGISRGNLTTNVIMPLFTEPTLSHISLNHYLYQECLAIKESSKIRQLLTDRFQGTLCSYINLHTYQFRGPIVGEPISIRRDRTSTQDSIDIEDLENTLLRLSYDNGISTFIFTIQR